MAYRASAIRSRQSTRWESNPHVRHTRTAGCHYITGASSVARSERPVGVEPTRPPWQGDRLPLHHGRARRSSDPEHLAGLEPAPRPWRSRMLPINTTGASTPTVEAVGIEPTSTCVRDRLLASVGHTSVRPGTRPGSGPEGIRTPDLLRDRETATPLARGTIRSVQAGGGGIEPRRTSRRFWRPSALPGAVTTCVSPTRVPRAGVEPDLGGLKDRRPHPKSNGAIRPGLNSAMPETGRAATTERPKKQAGRGSLLTPGRRGRHSHGSPGVTRSYPVRRVRRSTSHPDPNPDRVPAGPYSGPQDRPSSSRPRRSR